MYTNFVFGEIKVDLNLFDFFLIVKVAALLVWRDMDV